MTRSILGILSGEERDDAMAGFTQYAATSQTVETTFTIGPGTRICKAPLNTATTDARRLFGRTNTAPSVLGAGIYVVQGYTGTSAAPTANLAIVSDTAATPLHYIDINTSSQIVVRDKAGTAFATSVSTLPTDGASAKEWMVMFDSLTGSTVIVAIWVNGQIEAIVNTGLSHANFWSNGTLTWWDKTTGTSRGADAYGTHGVYTYCDSAVDSPLLKPWPRLYVVGNLPPTAEAVNEWTTGTTATPNGYQDVDDLGAPGSHPGHDSDTGRNQELTSNKRFTCTYSAANPLATTDTPLAVFMCSTGTNVSGGKVSYYHMLQLGGTDLANTSAAPGAGYQGYNTPMSKPGGGDWQQSDFDLSGGVSQVAYGMRTWTDAERGVAAIGAKVTDMAMLIAYQPQGAFFETHVGNPIVLGYGGGLLL